jgi:hypothetical protein
MRELQTRSGGTKRRERPDSPFAARRRPAGARSAGPSWVSSSSKILNLMGVKGNKAGEQSVSNALMALTKQDQLGRREGKYVPA